MERGFRAIACLACAKFLVQFQVPNKTRCDGACLERYRQENQKAKDIFGFMVNSRSANDWGGIDKGREQKWEK